MNKFTIQNVGIQANVNVLSQSIMLAGDYKFSARNTDMGDWLLCDGRSFPKKLYPELFAVVSTNFGSVDADHFNIPNFKGKVFGPISNTHPLGQSIGTEEEILTTDQLLLIIT